MRIVTIGGGAAAKVACMVVKKLFPATEISMISEETFPFYSACVFPFYLSGEIPRNRVFLRGKREYETLGVRTLFGEKVIDLVPAQKKIVYEHGEINYDSLILATGSKPIIPRIDGITLDGVYPLKTMYHADALANSKAKSVVVVGSGPVGIETAIALRKRGSKVSVIEKENRILPKLFDTQPAQMIEHELERKGIRIFKGEKILQVTGKKKVTGVETDSRTLNADTVILATGMKPRIELAKKAGIKIGKVGGVSVNEYMQTNFQDIYACGDCVETKDFITGEISLNLLWPNAVSQGKVAGNNVVSAKKKRYIGSVSLAIVDIFGTPALSIGYPREVLSRPVNEIERRSKEKYSKVVCDTEGKVFGVQLIGTTSMMNGILTYIRREILFRTKIPSLRGYFLLHPQRLIFGKFFKNFASSF